MRCTPSVPPGKLPPSCNVITPADDFGALGRGGAGFFALLWDLDAARRLGRPSLSLVMMLVLRLLISSSIEFRLVSVSMPLGFVSSSACSSRATVNTKSLSAETFSLSRSINHE